MYIHIYAMYFYLATWLAFLFSCFKSSCRLQHLMMFCTFLFTFVFILCFEVEMIWVFVVICIEWLLVGEEA